MRFVWLPLLAACWRDAPVGRAPAPDGEPAAARREPFPLRSKWSGVYRCTQGLSAVVLELDAEATGRLAATFTFGPTSENPTVPIGRYRLVGTIRPFAQGTFRIELVPDRWIGRAPDGYVMVPMSATSSRRWSRLAGRLDHPACGELDVRRSD